MMAENCENEEQTSEIEQVKNMLEDFDEDEWNEMNPDEKSDWVAKFIEK